MIITEIIEIDGTQFRRTYSDDNRYVVREGVSYDEAIDPMEYPREYTEGDKKPPEDEQEQEQDLDREYAEAGKILLGQEV